MKKITLILMVVLTIAACKKEKVDQPTSSSVIASTTPQQDSINLDSYYTQGNIVEKVNWLKNKGNLVYDTVLHKAVLDDHKVQSTVINQKIKYIKKWGELKKMIKAHRYDVYLNIEFKGETITGLKLVNKYIPDGDSVCYRFSPVLIRSLGKKYAKKNDNAKFKFSFASLDIKNKKYAEPVIIIQVDGNPYYDYSTDPKKNIPIPNLNKPL